MLLPDSLRQLVFWLAAVALAVGELGLLAVFLRRGPAPVAAGVRGRFSRAAELFMLLLPALLLASLYVLVWHAVNATGP